MNINEFFNLIDNTRKVPVLEEPYNYIWRYLSAFIVIFLTLLADLYFKIFHGYPSILLFTGVIFSTWYSGFGPGLLTILVAVLAINYYFIPPANALNFGPGSFLPQSLAFTLSAILISSLVESQRRTETMFYKLVERKKRFIADASHELFTPLSIIKAQSEVLLQSRVIDEAIVREVTATNIEEVNRMRNIVENLLELSLNEIKGETQISKQVELSEIAKKVAASIKILADKKNINLVVSSEASGKINGDATALTRLIINLLQNAIQYTNNGGQISLGVYNSSDQMELIVKDNGIGIMYEHLPNIFEPFYRSNRVRGIHKNGAGLGLSIVKSIVGIHRASIDITSELNSGTMVTVRFPKT